MEQLILPPYTTCRLCKNSMSEFCLAKCAPAKDYQDFELKNGISLEMAPRFPLQEFMQMPSKVRQVVVAAYLVLIVDYLQGVDRYERPIVRPHAYRFKRTLVSDIVQAASVPEDIKEVEPIHQASKTTDGNR